MTAWPFFALLLSLFVFYPELFFAKYAPLAADHLEQHYPWARLLAEQVKHFRLPFWTPQIQSGFPIAAEGQIGIFYLPNLFLSFLFPFHFAYSITPIVHFFLSGWGTYLYARRMQLEPLPAFTAAFIFVFGTAYGGAYYNITSLKTIAWFPWGLYFFENYCRGGGRRDLLFLSLAILQSLMAGYLQVAILSWAILCVALGLRLFIFNDSAQAMRTKLTTAFGLAFFLGLALLLALPQILLTFQLAMLSNRVGVTENYAYVGSMSPLALTTWMLPALQSLFRGNSIYGGMFSVLLVLTAVFTPESLKRNFFRLWVTVGALSLLLALGQWSPLYVGLVKLTHFYAFRTPMKFLVFICFSLAMLAGLGLQHALRTPLSAGICRKISAAFLGLASMSLAGSAGAWLGLRLFRKQIEAWGLKFIEHSIYGKAGHPHSLDVYAQKLHGHLDFATQLLSGSDPWQVWGYGLIIAHAALAGMLYRLGKITRPWLITGLLLLCADLYIFSWRDIKRDFDAYDNLKPDRLTEYLVQEKKRGKVGRIYTLRNPDEVFFLLPSVNMIYGLEDIGVYSPFVAKRYYETIGLLGNVNDSNFAYAPQTQFVMERLNLLRFLGVSHVMTRRVLDHPDLVLVEVSNSGSSSIVPPAAQFEVPDDGAKLYVLQGGRRPAYFISAAEFISGWEGLKHRFMAPGFDPRTVLLLDVAEKSRLKRPSDSVPAGGAEIRLQNDSPEGSTWVIKAPGHGFVVLPRSWDPGWEAFLDGHPQPVLEAYGFFQAVEIAETGEHTLRMHYSPWKAMTGKKT